MKVKSIGVVYGIEGFPDGVAAGRVFELDDALALTMIDDRGGVVVPADESAEKTLEKLREERAKARSAVEEQDFAGVLDARVKSENSETQVQADAAAADRRALTPNDTVPGPTEILTSAAAKKK